MLGKERGMQGTAGSGLCTDSPRASSGAVVRLAYERRCRKLVKVKAT